MARSATDRTVAIRVEVKPTLGEAKAMGLVVQALAAERLCQFNVGLGYDSGAVGVGVFLHPLDEWRGCVAKGENL